MPTPADYMSSMQEEPDLTDFGELSPELSRDFCGLRVWLRFVMSGADTFQVALDKNWISPEEPSDDFTRCRTSR